MRLLRRVTAWRFTLVSVILLTVEYAYLGIIIAKEFGAKRDSSLIAQQSQVQQNQDQLNQNQIISGRTQVIVYTMWRSGSTFLGDLLSSHPDVFYVFEPLKMFDGATSKSNAWVKHQGIRYLDDILNCNFTRPFRAAASARGEQRAAREFSKRFCRQGSCRGVRQAEQNCFASKYVVVKIIKIYTIDWLKEFTQRGVKIVNLVRDPRSRFWSQINAKLHDLHLLNDPEDAINNKRRHRHFHLLNDDAEDSSEPEAETENPLRAHIVHNMTNRHALVCKNNGDDIIKCLTQVKRDAVFRAAYTLVRFEDLAAYPYSTVYSLYDFLGINMHPNVIHFITMTTNYSDIINNDVYSTRKDSRQVLQKWRLEMPWDLVKRVQGQCSVVMEMLRYHLARNEQELRDLSRDLADYL